MRGSKFDPALPAGAGLRLCVTGMPGRAARRLAFKTFLPLHAIDLDAGSQAAFRLRDRHGNACVLSCVGAKHLDSDVAPLPNPPFPAPVLDVFRADLRRNMQPIAW